MSANLEILVLDDDALCTESIRMILEDKYALSIHHDVASATQRLSAKKTALAILDLHLKETSGLQVLREWKKRFPQMEVLVCSGEKDIEIAIECMRQGATDYIVKPFKKADLLLVVNRAIEKHALKSRVEKLSPLVLSRPVEMVAHSPKFQEIVEKIRLLKHQPHLNVMILGESGTGKEIIARLLNQQEEDPNRPFIVANMPAIPASLMESELFGFEKGAFTDAKISRAGKFELADGGDIFLDEIGDLPLEMQAKILRTLQEKQVERIGSGVSQQIQFRVISATNQPLAELMSKGRFREDLIYRLSDLVLWLPPLREHKEDIPPLVEHFLKKYTLSGSIPTMTESALQTLMDYHWPGNIRQLESTIKRAMIFNKSSVIETIEIYDPMAMNPIKSNHPANTPTAKEFDVNVNAYEKRLLEEAIQRHQGDKQKAFQELGLSKATFYRKLQQLGIQ